MQGIFGGVLTGGLVSVVALSVASVVSEQPAGRMPPAPPLVDAPQVQGAVVEDGAVVENGPVDDVTGVDVAGENDTQTGVRTPVGSVSVVEPVTPALPDSTSDPQAPASPPVAQTDVSAPRADTDPLDEPSVVAIEGTMTAPDAQTDVAVTADPDEPVFPSPQAAAPQTPLNEADLTVSTTPAAPFVQPDVADGSGRDTQSVLPEPEDVFVVDLGTDATVAPVPDAGAQNDAADESVAAQAPTSDQTLDQSPVDDAVPDPAPDPAPESEAESAPASAIAESVDVSPTPESAEIALALQPEPQSGPRVQLQGDGNSLLGDRDTGVTIRRLGSEPAEEATAETMSTDVPDNALEQFAADFDDPQGKPLMSVVLIDDGSMSAAAAALSGLPFPVTIGIDPEMADAADMMTQYRQDGFEVAVLAKVPEGAVPSDVEIAFASVFQNVPDSIAVLDIGDGGLQADRAVTEQAMEILAAQGRGFVTVSQGLNMAQRAAEQAGVPAASVYRDLDVDGQDARVIRRFIDQAAFRARQNSGVVLVGRVRPDTISAMILWGTANSDEQVAVVPLSAVLTAE